MFTDLLMGKRTFKVHTISNTTTCMIFDYVKKLRNLLLLGHFTVVSDDATVYI